MESDTALRWRITSLAPCWAELFTLRSFIKTRVTYKGKGGIRSRALYAISAAVIARGDDGRWKPNYSSVLGKFSAAAISNLYYPSSDRGASLVVFNGLAGIGEGAVRNLLREFVLKRITSHVPKGATASHRTARRTCLSSQPAWFPCFARLQPYPGLGVKASVAGGCWSTVRNRVRLTVATPLDRMGLQGQVLAITPKHKVPRRAFSQTHAGPADGRSFSDPGEGNPRRMRRLSSISRS